MEFIRCTLVLTPQSETKAKGLAGINEKIKDGETILVNPSTISFIDSNGYCYENNNGSYRKILLSEGAFAFNVKTDFNKINSK